MKRIFAGAIVIFTLILVIAAVTILVFTGEKPGTSETPYYEVVASAVWVVDGDTIDVKVVELTTELDPRGEISEGTIERIRFGGGIDAPEMNWSSGNPEPGAVGATELIENLLPTWTTVYLDIDNLAGSPDRLYRDVYGRLIAVIYVKLDEQWVNVNAELLRWGQEAYPDHDWLKYTYFTSEFDANEWLEENYTYVRE